MNGGFARQFQTFIGSRPGEKTAMRHDEKKNERAAALPLSLFQSINVFRTNIELLCLGGIHFPMPLHVSTPSIAQRRFRVPPPESMK